MSCISKEGKDFLLQAFKDLDLNATQKLALRQLLKNMDDCKKGRKKKGERAISGYNCYMKKCAESKDFRTCLTERGWATLSETEKDKYRQMAKEGCG